MDFNYTKIKIGNLLYKYCFPLYNLSYSKFKNRNDKEEIALLKRLINPGNIILDIGSNIGFYAKILASFTGPKGKVYCFEPDSKNFGYLVKNTTGINNVILFNKAVSDKSDTIKVYKSKLLNVDHRTYPVANYESVEEIDSVSIDELISLKKIDMPHLIKIDIQGYELTALKGMHQVLSTHTSLKIIAEYWPHGFKRAGTSAIAFYDFLNDLGYFFYLIDGNTLTKLTKEYIITHNDMPFEFSFNVLVTKQVF